VAIDIDQPEHLPRSTKMAINLQAEALRRRFTTLHFELSCERGGPHVDRKVLTRNFDSRHEL
jgi:hypothetical protein